MNIEKLANQAYDNAVEKGFELTDDRLEENLNKAIGELDEAQRHIDSSGDEAWQEVSNYSNMSDLNNTADMEIIDCYIRLLSIAYSLDIDFKETVISRMASATSKRCYSFPSFSLYITKLISSVISYDITTGVNVSPHLILSAISAIQYWCENVRDVDIWWLVKIKMEYNKTRPYLHGNKVRTPTGGVLEV